MSLKDDVVEMKKELEEVKQENFALSILSDYKKQNKRQFIVILVILAMWFVTIGYLVFVLNDIGTVEETIDIDEVEQIDNSTIKIGDELWEKLD